MENKKRELSVVKEKEGEMEVDGLEKEWRDEA